MSVAHNTISNPGEESVPESGHFEREGSEVLLELCSAFQNIIKALGSDGSPKQLSDSLELNRKLAWKISNLAREPRADVGRYVPGEQAVQLFLSAAGKRGVAPELTCRAASAAAAFRDLIDRHAGDRTSLDVLLSQNSDNAVGLDLETRRAAFRANAAIWGVRAQVLFRAEVFSINDRDPDRVDALCVRGLIGLQRMRPEGNWLLFRAGWYDANMQPIPGVAEPLDPDAARELGVPLLAKFSSQPVPALNRVPVRDRPGWINVMLAPGPVGVTGDANVVIADRTPSSVSRYGNDKDPTGMIGLRIRTPVETLIQDLIVEKGMFGPIDCKALVLSDLDSSVSGPGAERLPISCQVLAAGELPGALDDTPVPRYRSMLRHVLKVANLAHRNFEVYRMQLQYPVIPSSAAIQFPIPRRLK